MTKNKFISKLLTVAIVTVGTMATISCNDDDTPEEVIDYSGVVLDFSQVPLETAKKAIIGKWERVSDIGLGVSQYDNEYFFNITNSTITYNYRGNNKNLIKDNGTYKILKWEKKGRGIYIYCVDDIVEQFSALKGDTLVQGACWWIPSEHVIYDERTVINIRVKR